MVEFFLIGVSGVFVAALVGHRPEFFWPTLTAVAIVASGVMIDGYAIVDEYLFACVLIGGAFAIWARRAPSQTPVLRSAHYWAFLGMSSYGVLESVRG